MASDGEEAALSNMSLDNKAAVFMIAFEMEESDKCDKTSDANVSSNNSLESDGVNIAIQTSSDSKIARTAFVSADIEEITKRSSDDEMISKSYIRNGMSVETNNVGNIQIPLYNARSTKQELFLPRSALISTSTGLSAKDYLNQATSVTSNNTEQYQSDITDTQYAGGIQGDGALLNNAYGDTAYQTDSTLPTCMPTYTADQLFYDSSGLAYTYDGYQFYAAQNQPNFAVQHEQKPMQTSCILTKYGETTYVSYVPVDYLTQQYGIAQAFSQNESASDYNQCQTQFQSLQFIPPEYVSADCIQETEQAVPVGVQQVPQYNEWSTRDNAEPSDQDNKDDLAGVYESESGELLLIESVEKGENGKPVHSCKSWSDFNPPNIQNGVPVTADGLNGQESGRNDNIPADCPFPSLYVSDNGLITVLMREDIALEMTPSRDLRLVSHAKKLVVAANGRGSASFMIHPAVKLAQSGTTTDLELFLARKAKMTTDNITFGNNYNSYKFDYKKIVEEHHPIFKDFSKDESVDFLSNGNSSKKKEDLVSECFQKSSEAHFDYFSNGGYKVYINGVRVVQNSKGDVYVTNGPKFLRMSPSSSRLGIQTHFIEAAVEANWNIKIKRGTHTINASHLGFVVSNGQIEAAFDDRNRLRVFRLPDRIPLRLGQSRQRRPGVQRRRYPYRGPESESEEDTDYTYR